jgi:Cys-rich repeat protein
VRIDSHGAFEYRSKPVMMRLFWLLAGGVAAASAAACSVYGSNLVGSGGSGGSGSTASSTGATTTGMGGGSATPCSDVSQCPGMDTDCQKPACKGGFCQLDYTATGTAIAAQTKGDCQKLVCDGAGNTTSQADDADLPDDKNDCTTDGCAAGKPTTTNKPKTTACTSGGGAHCNDVGQCVECLSSSDCPSGVCNAMNACVAAQCNDTTKNGAETDVDCGGTTCPKCAAGKACLGDGDCVSATCTNHVCAATCADLAKDGQETDVDCGGACPACASGKHCGANADCQSGKCSAGTCADVLLISQVQSRGDNGGNDDFVEIYNPTSFPVVFDATWIVQVRGAFGGLAGCAMNPLATRFTGLGQTIPPHGHTLYANSAAVGGYNNSAVKADVIGATTAGYATGIPDAAAVLLVHGAGTKPVDALCFYIDATTQSTLTGCSAAYDYCEGNAVLNPHDNTPATNVDASLERKPGGAMGNTADTNDNASDFMATKPADPHDLASAPTP